MTIFSGLLGRVRSTFGPDNLAMTQALLAGDYDAAAQMAARFHQLQAEHERLRMRGGRADGGSLSPSGIGDAPGDIAFGKPVKKAPGVDFDPAFGDRAGASVAVNDRPAMADDHEALHHVDVEPALGHREPFHSMGLPPGGAAEVRPAALQEGFDRQQEHRIAEELARQTGRDPEDVLREMRGLPAQARPDGPARSRAGNFAGAVARTGRIESFDPVGDLSAQFESPGAGTVSSGRNDPGGPSSGTWQMTGSTVRGFLASGHGQRWANELQGLRPGTPPFNAAWSRITQREPGPFQDAQYKFLYWSLYNPVAKQLMHSNVRFDVNSMPPIIREIAWSTAMQHGSARQLLENAVQAADRLHGRNDPQYVENLIRRIYDERIRLARRLEQSHSGNPGEARTFANMANLRFPQEMNVALRRYRQERGH